MRKDRRGLIVLIAVFLLAVLLLPLSCPGKEGEETKTSPSTSLTPPTTSRRTTTTSTTTRTSPSQSDPTETDPSEPPEDPLPEQAGVYQTLAPSVVSVHVTIPASSLYSKREEFFSGLILDESGLIVTSYSPLERALDYRGMLLPDASIRIYVKDQPQAFAASLVGFHSTVDLALIKIRDPGDLIFPALPLSREPDLAVGTAVFTIGYPPVMVKEGGLSAGYITSLYRTSLEEDGSPVGLIETSIPTLPIYAGSPLVNREGEVVAITSGYLKRIYNQHQGFAVPSPIVLDVVDRLMLGPDDRPESKAELGITILEDQEAEELRLMFGYPAGLYINFIKQESAAYTAGLDTGDILLSINGQVMESARDFLTFMDGQAVGSLLEIVVYRPSEDRSLVKTCYLLEARP